MNVALYHLTLRQYWHKSLMFEINSADITTDSTELLSLSRSETGGGLGIEMFSCE